MKRALYRVLDEWIEGGADLYLVEAACPHCLAKFYFSIREYGTSREIKCRYCLERFLFEHIPPIGNPALHSHEI